MKVSLNILKHFLNFELPGTDELVERINQQIGGVEEVLDLGKKYQGIVIVRVAECAPLEGSDHLKITKIDDGGIVNGVERGEDGLVQVVCGAQNVHEGMFAVWLAPGVTVPESYDDAEPFILSARPLRGVISNGMLASPKELAFGDSHEGILEINPTELTSSQIEIKPGVNFAEVFDLTDHIIDIENKMFTHRPDCFGVLGVAREIAGIFGQKFEDPDWYWRIPGFESAKSLELNVFNETPDNVQRFMVLVMKDVDVKSSPIWLQSALIRLGSKPINNIVDITNYAMLLTGQPTHAYDYDKLRGSKLGVRMAKSGETVELLNGKTIELNEADIAIVDGEGVVGLGGIMGGSNSEVSHETKNIVLEVANFDMYTLRRSSMRHGLFTDASTRFTKGQSPLQTDRVLNLLLQMIKDTANGSQASSVVDLHKEGGDYDTQTLSGSLKVETQFINERLGLQLDNRQIEKILQNVTFTCYVNEEESTINITAPFWRTDIKIPEDVVEEVGRLYGFHHLPQELPFRTIIPAKINKRRRLKEQLRVILSTAGANEVLTYSFVHKNLLEKTYQSVQDAYQLSNALSPDLHYMRLSVLPSLLDKLYVNSKASHDRFALFEIGKGHRKSYGLDEDGVPKEKEYVSLAVSQGDYYDTKMILEWLAQKLNLDFEYKPIEEDGVFEKKRSARIVCGEFNIGTIGEIATVIKRNLKLPDVSSGFEIDFDLLVRAIEASKKISYKPLSRFPSIERDITLKVMKETAYKEVEQALVDILKETELVADIRPGTIYQPELSSSKNITFHISLASSEKTLTSEEANILIQKVCEHANSTVGATVV